MIDFSQLFMDRVGKSRIGEGFLKSFQCSLGSCQLSSSCLSIDVREDLSVEQPGVILAHAHEKQEGQNRAAQEIHPQESHGAQWRPLLSPLKIDDSPKSVSFAWLQASYALICLSQFGKIFASLIDVGHGLEAIKGCLGILRFEMNLRQLVEEKGLLGIKVDDSVEEVHRLGGIVARLGSSNDRSGHRDRLAVLVIRLV